MVEGDVLTWNSTGLKKGKAWDEGEVEEGRKNGKRKGRYKTRTREQYEEKEKRHYLPQENDN